MKPTISAMRHLLVARFHHLRIDVVRRKSPVMPANMTRGLAHRFRKCATSPIDEIPYFAPACSITYRPFNGYATNTAGPAHAFIALAPMPAALMIGHHFRSRFMKSGEPLRRCFARHVGTEFGEAFGKAGRQAPRHRGIELPRCLGVPLAQTGRTNLEMWSWYACFIRRRNVGTAERCGDKPTPCPGLRGHATAAWLTRRSTCPATISVAGLTTIRNELHSDPSAFRRMPESAPRRSRLTR